MFHSLFSSIACGELLSVGDPVLHRKADSITGKYGVWLQDPEPQGPHYTNKTVWRIDAVGKDVRQLFAFEDMDQFSRGFPMKVLVLPEPVESTGATIYRGLPLLPAQTKSNPDPLQPDLREPGVTTGAASRGFHGQYLTPGEATQTLTSRWTNKTCGPSTARARQKAPLWLPSWTQKAWWWRRAGDQHQEEHSGQRLHGVWTSVHGGQLH